MNARLAAPPHRLEDRHRHRHRVRPAGGRRGLRRRRAARRATSPAAARRCSRTASAARTRRCPARSTAACPPTRSSRCTRPDDEDNPIVEESEPELEALADTAEPEAVTEDAAAFGDPEPEEFPAGPGDAPVDGEDATLESGAAQPCSASRTTPTTACRSCTSTRSGEAARRLARSGPAPAAAARRRRRELQRFHERGRRRSCPAPAPGAASTRAGACLLRARARRAGRSTASCAGPSASTRISPGSTLDDADGKRQTEQTDQTARRRPRTGGAASSSTAAPAGPARASASVPATARPIARRRQPREVAPPTGPVDRRVGRHAARLLAGARRLDAADHQDADGPRHDEDRDPDAHRRRGRADRRRARAAR